MKVVICTIIVVITSNLIRKITLNMFCSVPCCEVHQIFFFWLSMVTRSAITTLKLKEVSTVNGMFTELQTALSIFQKEVAIAESGSPLTLFQDLFVIAVGLSQNSGCTFVPLSKRINVYVIQIEARHGEARQSLGQCIDCNVWLDPRAMARRYIPDFCANIFSEKQPLLGPH